MGMDPILPNNPMRPAAAATCPAAGNWRLDRLPKSQTVFLALALSLGVHTAFLLAFNRHAPRAIWVPIPVVPPTGDPMPPEPDEPPPPSTEVIDLKEPPPVNVPRLPDAPSRIDLHSDFVEPLQLPPPLTELTRDKLSKIPTNIPSDRRRPAENIFELKDLGRAPRAIAQPAPRFPRELQNQAVSAEVVVEFIVDTSGSVRNAAVVSSTHPGFDRAAVDGVRQWKFQPGLKDGRKVNTRLRQPIRFTLDNTPGT